jgi:hypothetical protein
LKEKVTNELSPAMLVEMDSEGDGVDQFEFVLGTLITFQKITREDVEIILRKFDSLDKDGILNF